jgi:pimeloyl-ACP methyl ester carboxylesterase
MLEALGIERPALVGHSMGGTIALEMAARRRPGLACVVAVNPVVTGRVYSRTIVMHDGWVDSAVRVSRRVWPTASRLLARPPQAVRRRAPPYALRNGEDLATATADSVLGSMRAVLRWDLRDRLALIEASTLIVVGSADRVVSPEEGEIAAQQIPGAELLVLPAGHHPNDEAPGEFFSHLEAFLSARGNL